MAVHLATVKVTVVVRVSAPLVPVMVRVEVPNFVLRDVVTVNVEESVAGLGLKLALAPPRRPVTLSFTGSANPPAGVIVTV